MLQAKDGVYLQHTNQLDLSRDVTLYRDDGTTVTTSQRLDRPEEWCRRQAPNRRMPKARSALSMPKASPSPTREPPSNSPAPRALGR